MRSSRLRWMILLTLMPMLSVAFILTQTNPFHRCLISTPPGKIVQQTLALHQVQQVHPLCRILLRPLRLQRPPLLATGELDPSHLVQSQQSVFGNYFKMEWFFALFDLHLLVGPCPSPWRMKHFLSLLSFTTFLLSMWIAPNRGSLHVVIANICWLRRSRRPWRWAPRGVTSYGTTVVRTLQQYPKHNHFFLDMYTMRFPLRSPME